MAEDAVYRCEECGFDMRLDDARSCGERIAGAAARIAAVVAGRPRGFDQRPATGTWSVLEYGCHVRDVLLVQRERVLAALRVDRPVCEPMGRDERVEHDGYSGQDPGDVARQIADAAAMFANVLARLPDGAWARTVVYTYPRTWERSLRWVAVHTLHEMHHHLGDIARDT